MSHLQGRIARLERREGALAGAQGYYDHPTFEGYFNTLTTREEREEFLVLAQDVHAIQRREIEALDTGQAIPPRSADEQARIDELDRCVEVKRGDEGWS